MQMFENFLSPKPLNKILRILNTNSVWVCVIKICLNGIYWRNNSQRQFEHRKFNANLGKSSSPKPLDTIF